MAQELDKEIVRPQDGLAVSAFLLALLIMVLPLEADFLDALLHRRRFVIAAMVAVVCFAAVFTPFLRSWQRRRREPKKWRGFGYLIAAGVILALNLLLVGTVFTLALRR